MEKYIWKVINYIFFIGIITAFIALSTYSLVRTYNNIKYYRSSITGIIINKEVRDATSSEGGSYTKFSYEIKTDDNKIYKSGTGIKQNFQIGDSIEGIKISSNSIKILSVNYKKTNSKYNFLDLLSLFITLIIPILIFILTKKITC